MKLVYRVLIEMYQEMEEIMAKEEKTPLFNCAKEFVSFNPFIQNNISKLK